jgi:hypothetical protein
MFQQFHVLEENTHPCQRLLYGEDDRATETQTEVCEKKMMTFGATYSPCAASFIMDMNVEP